MEWTINLVSLIAGVVTIIWFIRDVKKENSKVLKSIHEIQKSTQEIQIKGFETLSTDLKYIADLLVKK